MRKFDYALVLVEFLRRNWGDFCDIGAIAKEYGFPSAYLEKVAQELKRAGFLEARRGFGGGYRLTEEARTLTVQDLINFYAGAKAFCPIIRVKGSGVRV